MWLEHIPAHSSEPAPAQNVAATPASGASCQPVGTNDFNVKQPELYLPSLVGGNEEENGK